MRFWLIVATLLFVLLALIAFAVERSDIQLIIAFQGLGFAIVFWSLATLRKQLDRIEIAESNREAQRSGFEAVSRAVLRVDG
jgi:hypothetical protein